LSVTKSIDRAIELARNVAIEEYGEGEVVESVLENYLEVDCIAYFQQVMAMETFMV
jgi:hypothetical protein